MHKLLIIFVVTLLLFPDTLPAEEGIIVRAASLKQTSSFSSKTLSTLPTGTQIQLAGRKGGWQQVNVKSEDGLQGWVRTYQVRANIKSGTGGSTAKRKKSKGGVLSGLTNLSRRATGLFGRRSSNTGSDDVVATIGVRGLSEKDLKTAKPNPQELQKMDSFAISKKTAKKFAELGGLQSRQIAKLPKPGKKK